VGELIFGQDDLLGLRLPARNLAFDRFAWLKRGDIRSILFRVGLRSNAGCFNELNRQ
jgi:hypothetical protein